MRSLQRLAFMTLMIMLALAISVPFRKAPINQHIQPRPTASLVDVNSIPSFSPSYVEKLKKMSNLNS